MHSRRPARILASAIALLTVLSCGDSPTDPALPGAPDSPRPVSASLNPATLQLSALGETAQLTAEIRDQLGSPLQGAQVWWSSSEPAVATVDAAGLVTAIARGEATVTATSGQVGGTVSVAVRQSAHSVTCLDGRAGFYPCDGVDLLGRVSAGGLRPGWLIQDLNDVWGWTDPLTGTEYALVGRTYFESGVLVVSSMGEGLFVLRLQR